MAQARLADVAVSKSDRVPKALAMALSVGCLTVRDLAIERLR
jgi:hypothetical protein